MYLLIQHIKFPNATRGSKVNESLPVKFDRSWSRACASKLCIVSNSLTEQPQTIANQAMRDMP